MPPSRRARILDFDLETVAAGFGDPQWVPNRVVVWAHAWCDERQVTVDALPVAAFYDVAARREFLRPLIAAIGESDQLTCHNLKRFDMGILNADLMRLGLPLLKPKLVQDTMRLPKSKGLKKGQDNLSHMLGVRAKKLPLTWAEWEAAYAEPDLATVKERCASDVVMHMEMRDAMRERGLLAAPQWWKP